MILSVADITFAYNGKPVLKDLTFEATPGEIVAVLGVNGAGKSTLLKCINRILQPRTGTILVGGRDLVDMSRMESARRIGYVPQHRADEEIVVFDAVLLGRKPHIRWAATRRDMEITEQVIAQTGLSPLAMRPVNRLSGGEAQKVIIARALAQEPKVLLLDEPTNSLDVRNQLEIMGLLRNLTRARSLVTIVSVHDLNLALRFADRFLLIKDGSISSAVDRNHLSPEMIREAYGIKVVLSEIAGFPVAVPINDIEELTSEKETA